MFILRLIEIVINSIFRNGNASIVSYDVVETTIKSDFATGETTKSKTVTTEVDVVYDQN